MSRDDQGAPMMTPRYLATGREVQLFEHAFHRRLPVMLTGPTGCGKTRLVEHMARRLDRPVVTISCHDDLTSADLVGRFLVSGGDVVWQDGPLTRAVRNGAICYLQPRGRRDTTMASTSTDLPLGTSPENNRMHTIIRRVCYVLLFGLVLEGAVTFPLLAVWYGWPQLSPRQLCSGLQQVMYSDKSSECRFPYPLGGPPFGGPSEVKGETTSQDLWSIQPKPGYPAIGYRQLVKNEKGAAAPPSTTKPTPSTTTAPSRN